METVAQVLARELLDAGIDIVYGIPGGENVEVLDALRQAGIRFVLVHHEASAVFMADATARLTGKPSACLTTLGPGAANSIVGVAHAYLDRAPVLVITSQIPDRLRPHQTHQFLDLAALFAPITKASLKVEPHPAAQTVRHALQLAQSDRPGPVHLQLSNEDAALPAIRGDRSSSTPARRSQPKHDLAAASELIARARRPAIVTGLGLEPERPYEALRQLAEAAQAPTISTPKAKGSLPDDHPLAAGTIGLTRNDPAYQILDEADCILAIGLDVVELVKPWEERAPLIWIAPWENCDPALEARAEFVGPITPVLAELCSVECHAARNWGERRVERQRQESAREELPAPTPGRMMPQAVFRALRAAAPRDAIVTTDVGSHKILASLTWQTYTPNSFLVSNGLSTMGFSLPAAIAASLDGDNRPVICTTGDAGLAMALGELGVLARYGTAVTVVVFDDGALDLIRAQQLRAGKPAYGTEFDNPDFVRLAEAFGIKACRVGEEAQLARELQLALASHKPSLIDALIDPSSYPTTPKATAP